MNEPRVVPLRSTVSDWLRRAILAVRGADRDLEAAELALARGDVPRALRHARALAREVPDMPASLAVAADAAAMSGLYAEARAHADALAARVSPSARIELARGLYARLSGERGEGTASLRRAATLPGDPEASGMAALWLAEDDLDGGEPARALQWLRARAGDAATILRATALLDLGRTTEAEAEARALPLPPTDGRHALLWARLAELGNDRAPKREALRALFRAYVLDVPGAGRALARHVSLHPDDVDAVRPVVEQKGDLSSPLFRAAFATVEGDLDGARRALMAGARAGDLEAARALAQLAVAAFDADLLKISHDAMRAAGGSPPEVESLLVLAAAQLHGGDPRAALGALGDAGDGAFATCLRERAFDCLVPSEGPIALPGVTAELRAAARTLGDDASLSATESLIRSSARPLCLSVFGEFNAGKSTLLNAMLGADLAPTSMLPTTAVLHHVRFAVDPYARIALSDGTDRVVDPVLLAPTLREIADSPVRALRVTVGLPFEPLRKVELIDTPGFNAPDADHTDEARRALDEVDVALWLFDATQLGKASEIARLREISALGVPIVCIANKRDRLKAGEIDVVVAALTRALGDANVSPLAPPLLLSAKLALADKLGGAAADSAAFAAFDEMFASTVLGQAGALHERSLRRRAATITAGLCDLANQRARVEAEAETDAQRRHLALVAASARLDDRAGITKAIGEAAAAPRLSLAADLAAVGQASDDEARAYVQERVVAHLAPALAAVAFVDGAPPDAVVAAVEAALYGLVAGMPRPSSASDLPATVLAQATVGAARRALADAIARPPRASAEASRAATRLAILHRALSRQIAGTAPLPLLSPVRT